MFASNNLSAADVAAVTGGNRNNGFGDGDGWWIILLALLFGWGRNGAFGGGYGSGNGSCCQNREAISGVNYNMATSTNAVTTAISNAARDITENQNTNYRQLHDELVTYRMEDKDNTIAELRSQVNALNLSASQSNQNAYLVAQLKTPAPVPAYTVPNPNGYYGCQQNCYQSCGC